MLQHLYPCRILWRTSSETFRNSTSIQKSTCLHHIKYMCVQSTNISQGKEKTSPENVREIPIQLKYDQEEKEPQMKQSFKGKTTYSETEVNKFRLIADSWWDVDGEFKPLHSLNKLRVALIRNGLVQSGISNPSFAEGAQPLKGLKLLDVGCGGGILCEPLARLGAQVTGLDAANENLEVAELHAQREKRVSENVSYIHGTIEEHADNVTHLYDGVIASEVLEHVESVELFLDTCVSITKPGGSLFFTTINKTTQSWLGAIIAAEYLLCLLPRGTHDWNRFVPPQDLRFLLERGSCSIALQHGMFYVPVRNEWFWVSDSSVNYALHAIKPGQ